MPFVTARGLRFHTQQLGPGRETEGAEGGRPAPPVVMLHGLFTGSLASWWFTAAPAVARTHTVRLLDLRGHGLSDCPPDGYDTATMVDDVLALTDDLAPFAVVGHSYGGLLGIRLALAHPDRVTALACIEAPLVAMRDPGPHASRSAGPLGPEGAVAGGAASGEDGPDDERDAPAPDASDTERRLLTETTIVADLRAEPPVTDDDLRALAVPTLFAFGSRSWCAPAADRVRAVLPGAPCHVLEGGHALHLDARREVADLLVDFLDEPGRGAAPEAATAARITRGGAAEPGANAAEGPTAEHDPLHHDPFHQNPVPYG